MSRRKINFIIVLMTLALVGLLGFQLFWINNAIRLTTQRFQQDVQESLERVASKLEENEKIHLAIKTGSARIADPTNISIKAHDESLKSEEVPYSFGYVSGANQVSGKKRTYIEKEYVLKSNQNSTTTLIQAKVKLDSTTIVMSSGSAGSDDVGDASDSGTIRVNLNRLVERKHDMDVLLDEILRLETDPENRVHPQFLDSLLRNEFVGKGITATYEFGIYDGDVNTFVLSNANDQRALEISSHKANLFPNDLLGGTRYLLVNFPRESRFLLKNIWATLLSSFVLILIIVYCFYYAIATILKQKKLTEMKNDFINNMTHELKTPLTTVALAAEALGEKAIGGNPEMHRRYLGVIRDETSRLVSQVESVLQTARMENDDFELKFQEFDVKAVLEEVIRKFQIQLEEKAGEVLSKFKGDLFTFTGDKVHIATLFQNLIDNAIKYSRLDSAPRIEIDLMVEKDVLEFIIKDHGIGIGKEHQSRIFHQFYRVHGGLLHDYKGFGLGLNYAQKIAEAHNGEITVESSPGTGSTFRVILISQAPS